MSRKKMLLDTNYVIDLANVFADYKRLSTKDSIYKVLIDNVNDAEKQIVSSIEKQFNDKQLLAISKTRNSNYVDFKAFNDMYNDMLKCKRLTPEERIKVVGYKIENYKQLK